MTTTDFSTTLVVDQTPEVAFNAIVNLRGWWSEDIEGSPDKLDETFTYHYEDAHYCKMKLIEVIPGRKVVWLVLDNHFNFTIDKTEWRNTRLIFEIEPQGTKIQIRFTHEGLVPEYECYDICHDAWTNYIQNSLRDLITTGKGQPNPKGGRNPYQENLSRTMSEKDHHISFTVNATPHETFTAINNVSKWWADDLRGSSQKLNDQFTVRFNDIHVSTQKLIEVVPDKRVVWLVTDSRLNFLKDKHEWTNTKIEFEISSHNGKTRVNFTHIGLTPVVECYSACVQGWNYYINGSLYKLLTEGKGTPGITNFAD